MEEQLQPQQQDPRLEEVFRNMSCPTTVPSFTFLSVVETELKLTPEDVQGRYSKLYKCEHCEKNPWDHFTSGLQEWIVCSFIYPGAEKPTRLCRDCAMQLALQDPKNEKKTKRVSVVKIRPDYPVTDLSSQQQQHVEAVGKNLIKSMNVQQ